MENITVNELLSIIEDKGLNFLTLTVKNSLSS